MSSQSEGKVFTERSRCVPVSNQQGNGSRSADRRGPLLSSRLSPVLPMKKPTAQEQGLSNDSANA